jgi:phosphate transport system protein
MHIIRKEIADYKNELLAMASHAEGAIVRSVKALLERDDQLAKQVIADDVILNNFEMKVDDMALHLLSQAPLAKDLRMITAGMGISSDLERIGDEAAKIARRTIELNKEPDLKEYVDLQIMAERAIEMLRVSLDSFVEGNSEKAREVLPMDRTVNQLNGQIHQELANYIAKSPDNISRSLSLMVVSKSLERVADHAKNIAEEAVFAFEGLDIRHGGGIRSAAG